MIEPRTAENIFFKYFKVLPCSWDFGAADGTTPLPVSAAKNRFKRKSRNSGSGLLPPHPLAGPADRRFHPVPGGGTGRNWLQNIQMHNYN